MGRPLPTVHELVARLGASFEDPAARELGDLLGAPISERRRRIGYPGLISDRIRRSAGELFVHDGIVTAIRVTAAQPRHRAVIDGVVQSATLPELAALCGARPSFSGLARPYFSVAGGFIAAEFPAGNWNKPGRLRGITLTTTTPGLECAPQTEDCEHCADLVVLDGDHLDRAATISALSAAVSELVLTEDPMWVTLNDLVPLQRSQLMPRVESQLGCRHCRRIVCVTALADGSIEVEYCTRNRAMKDRMTLVPDVALWGDAERIAADASAMRCIDHERGLWFLLGKGDSLFLDARVTISTVADGSALIQLNQDEIAAYSAVGRDFLTTLARQLSDDAPLGEESRFHHRDLTRAVDGEKWEAEASAAIKNQSWLGRNRQ